MKSATLERNREVSNEGGCPKCGSRMSRTEPDAVGLMRICIMCGSCTYLNRENEEMNVQESREETNSETQELPKGATETEPASRNGKVTTASVPREGDGDGDGQVCPSCGREYDRETGKRFRRRILLRCDGCETWAVNPAGKFDLGKRETAIGAVIEMSMASAPISRIKRQMDGLNPDVQVTSLSIRRWMTRYAVPAAERMRAMTATGTGNRWELGSVRLQRKEETQQAWVVLDARTQYLLNLGRTQEGLIDRKILEQAERVAGGPPKQIILGPEIPREPDSLADYIRDRNVSIVREAEENPDGSMGRFRKAVRDRAEKRIGNMRPETLDETLDAIALSINSFEECAGREQTPAERAGMESLYLDWADLVEKEEKNPLPRRPRTERNADTEARAVEPDQTAEKAEAAPETETGPDDAPGEPTGNRPGNLTLARIMENLEERERALLREMERIRETRRTIEETIRILEDGEEG